VNAGQAAALRKEFPEASIGLLPKVSCKACTDSQDKSCGKPGHQKSKCRECGAWISGAHVHLSYIGHAETTDRFLEVDPEWTWEPFSLDQHGLPLFDSIGGLWIRLTIAGVTRPGYGSADGKKGGNAVKEAIGDALRNGGMRFGVALSLWAKSDLAALHADKETGEVAATAPPAQPRAAEQSNGNGQSPVNAAKGRVWTAAQALGWDRAGLAEHYRTNTGAEIASASVTDLDSYAELLAAIAEDNAAVPA